VRANLIPQCRTWLRKFLKLWKNQSQGSQRATLDAILELSGAFMAMTIAVFVVYVLFAAGVRERIVTLRRTFAGGFIALGARVAFAER
jgi:hypothetical protein